MNFDDEDFEMVVDLPIGVDSEQIKMEATSTEDSFRLVVDVVGPFSLQQKEIMKTLCDVVNANYVNNSTVLNNLN